MKSLMTHQHFLAKVWRKFFTRRPVVWSVDGALHTDDGEVKGDLSSSNQSLDRVCEQQKDALDPSEVNWTKGTGDVTEASHLPTDYLGHSTMKMPARRDICGTSECRWMKQACPALPQGYPPSRREHRESALCIGQGTGSEIKVPRYSPRLCLLLVVQVNLSFISKIGMLPALWDKECKIIYLHSFHHYLFHLCEIFHFSLKRQFTFLAISLKFHLLELRPCDSYRILQMSSRQTSERQSQKCRISYCIPGLSFAGGTDRNYIY